jgi:hypothetical protein
VPVIISIIVLALASAIRPTSLAAVYALLMHGRSPTRLLAAYVLAGLAFTITFGVVVIAAFDSVSLKAGSSRTKGIAEVAAGVVALAFGLAVLTGRVGRRRPEDATQAPGRLEQILGGNISTRAAAVAGPATHIPGLLYLLALDLIVASQHGLTLGLADVLVYNAVWFALPVAAFALYIVNPLYARRAVVAVQEWTSAHSRQIILIVLLVGGPALILAGWLTI